MVRQLIEMQRKMLVSEAAGRWDLSSLYPPSVMADNSVNSLERLLTAERRAGVA